MPARNCEGTVAQALISLLRDIPVNSEVLILNDDSSDDTLSAIASVRDTRIKVESAKTNIGVTEALNALLGRASAKTIARMDADDVWLPGRATKQFKELSSGVDICFTNRVFFGRQLLAHRPDSVLPIHPEAFPYFLLIGNPVAHSSMMAKAEGITTLGGYRQTPAEDYDLWIRSSLHGLTLSRIRSIGLAYRLHENQVTKNENWRKQFSADELVLGSRIKLAKHLGLSPARLEIPHSSKLRGAVRLFNFLTNEPQLPRSLAIRLTVGSLLSSPIRSPQAEGDHPYAP